MDLDKLRYQYIFKDASFVRYCVEAECALARAQATSQVIPENIGEILSTQLHLIDIDMDRLRRETEIVGYPILPLVMQLSEGCSDREAAKYIHWGATTQDIMDLATMCQIRDGLKLIEMSVAGVMKALAMQAEKHKHTPMAGRTHLQHALPVTFGYKCAVLLSAFQRHWERLQQIKPRALLVQLGGAAGTLASMGAGDEGIAVRRRLAQDLHLHDPPVTWHVARDGIAEVLNLFALIGGTLGKMALDFAIMCSNEFGELAEPFVPHRGASSTMPQKRNPISSEIILASSKVLKSNAGLTLDAMVSDFERASGPWHLEWIAVPESFMAMHGALSQAEFILKDLVVDEPKMAANLDSTNGQIVAEAVMMGLAPRIGRQTAHEVVYEACRQSYEQRKPLLDCLLQEEEVTSNIGQELLASLCEPRNYLGSCAAMVDATLKLQPILPA